MAALTPRVPAPNSGSPHWSSTSSAAQFWDTGLDSRALWNLLQHQLDRRHNPLLRGGEGSNGTGATSNDSLPFPWAWGGMGGMGEMGAQGGCAGNARVSSAVPDFNTLPARVQAFLLAMHCRDYPLLVDQPTVCQPGEGQGGNWSTLLLAIKSESGNFEQRQAIRETWGWAGLWGGRWQVHTVFLLGRQDGEVGPYPELGPLLRLEAKQHRDILQWDFHDTFLNLTLKGLLFLRWLPAGCPQAQFVFQGDDDVFLNTGALLQYLASLDPSPSLFIGDVIENAAPVRDPTEKYYVPASLFEGAYPPYAGGGGLLYSGALAWRLRRAAERVVLFPIDDVFLGMCLQRLGVTPMTHPGFHTFDLPDLQLRSQPCAHRNLLLVHRRSPAETLALWSAVNDPHLQC
ncbi:B3GN2 acetylglucosaminyltransferase, partial [Amia calva]|nr:B3GN2 acetylglucosaminyltransferase [Amia calva]